VTRLGTDAQPRRPYPDADSIRGLSVWVTGASGGLGLALARGLVSAVARVAMTSRPGVELERGGGRAARRGW